MDILVEEIELLIVKTAERNGGRQFCLFFFQTFVPERRMDGQGRVSLLNWRGRSLRKAIISKSGHDDKSNSQSDNYSDQLFMLKIHLLGKPVISVILVTEHSVVFIPLLHQVSEECAKKRRGLFAEVR